MSIRSNIKTIKSPVQKILQSILKTHNYFLNQFRRSLRKQKNKNDLDKTVRNKNVLPEEGHIESTNSALKWYTPIFLCMTIMKKLLPHPIHRVDRNPSIISDSNKFIAAMIKPEANEDQTTMLIVLEPDGLVSHIHRRRVSN